MFCFFAPPVNACESDLILCPVFFLLQNGGGVTVSYFEWVQNLQCFRWTEEEVNQRLDRTMTDAFAAIWSVHKAHKVPLRTAAFMLALQRVSTAAVQRGFF